MKRNLSSTQYTDPVSHDGIHDALTHLGSPSLFYEVAYLEIARSDRESSPLTLFQFTLNQSGPSVRDSHYEIAVINFAKAIRSISRQSEISARVGKFEFFSLLHINEGGAKGYISRLSEVWVDSDYLVAAKSVTRMRGESLLPLLNRLELSESSS